jgi:hypothetical protein
VGVVRRAFSKRERNEGSLRGLTMDREMSLWREWREERDREKQRERERETERERERMDDTTSNIILIKYIHFSPE